MIDVPDDVRKLASDAAEKYHMSGDTEDWLELYIIDALMADRSARATASEQALAEAQIEIEAVKSFGIGFYSEVVTEETRRWYRTEARIARAHNTDKAGD